MKRFLYYFAVIYLAVLILAILYSEIFFGDRYAHQNVLSILEFPSLNFWFGTDTLGRDLFARTLHAARNSLIVGICSALLGIIIGMSISAVGALTMGLVDKIILRMIDLFSAIPSFMLTSACALYLQVHQYSHWNSLVVLILSISLANWMYIARIMRGKILSIKNEPYIEAAQALGLSSIKIAFSHIFPNAMSQILILFAMQVPLNIIFESMISFIGLGVLPPQSSWGLLIKEGWRYLADFPHLLLIPSLLMFLTIWSIHVILDYLQQMDWKQSS